MSQTSPIYTHFRNQIGGSLLRQTYAKGALQWLDETLQSDLNLSRECEAHLASLRELAGEDLVADLISTTTVAGFDLPRKNWTKLNRFRTGHGRCGSMLFKWGLTDTEECDCGAAKQSMEHIINDCPIRKFQGGLLELNRVTPAAIEWLSHLDLNI